jgi:1-acyl-sn-glycerol-3-phosphate acyltransferase
MQKLFNAVLRFIVSIALKTYFSKIVVFGKENIPQNKAVIIVGNHQNALIDPILLATHTSLKPFFLTRASVFKKQIVAKMLRFIRMIPVYRVRDGIANMEKNKETFDQCVQVLTDSGSLIIFGEGNHHHHRNLRPIRKGFARIAYQALEEKPDLDLVILPVGINYANPHRSGSIVSLRFGPTLDPKSFYPQHDALVKALQKSLLPLVSNISDDGYDEKLNQLISQKTDLTDPDAVNTALKKEIIPNHPDYYPPYFTNKVMKIFHLPIYLLWLNMAPRIKDPAFIATWKFIFGLVGVPIWYFLLLFILPELGLGTWAYSWAILAFFFLLANRSGQG